MSYQDHWVKGRLVKRGRRSCEQRYVAIKAALNDLPRPFYVLDLGAHSGYFSFRLAEEMGAFVTAVDSCTELSRLAGLNNNRRVIVIPRNIDLAELRQMGKFDAILALSVLHHLPDWQAWLNALIDMTPRLVLETPHPAEVLPTAANRAQLTEIHTAVADMDPKRIAVVPGHDRSKRRETVIVQTANVIPLVHETIGIAFSGSGNAGKALPLIADRLAPLLGYRPFRGSLNLRVTERLDLGPPVAKVTAPREFSFWPAKVNGTDCHVMQPGIRGWPHSIEIVAPVKLRDTMGIQDGDSVTVTLRNPFELGICTTAWGGYEKYLPEWAESVCRQTRKPAAVTIVATLAADMRGKLGAMFDRAEIPWKSVEVPEGYDMGALRNLAVQHTQTEWVMHLDADDMLEPWCVSDCTALANGADVISIGYKWNGVGRRRPPVRLHLGASAKRALEGHLVSHSPSPFRRKLWEQRPYLTGDLVDTALWIGFAHLGARFVPTTRHGFIYRGHVDSHSNTITPERRRVAKRQLEEVRKAK